MLPLPTLQQVRETVLEVVGDIEPHIHGGGGTILYDLVVFNISEHFPGLFKMAYATTKSAQGELSHAWFVCQDHALFQHQVFTAEALEDYLVNQHIEAFGGHVSQVSFVDHREEEVPQDIFLSLDRMDPKELRHRAVERGMAAINAQLQAQALEGSHAPSLAAGSKLRL